MLYPLSCPESSEEITPLQNGLTGSQATRVITVVAVKVALAPSKRPVPPVETMSSTHVALTKSLLRVQVPVEVPFIRSPFAAESVHVPVESKV